MSVETVTYISDLNTSLPAFGDPKSEGDDHIRNLKSSLKTTFPSVTGAVTATHTELNHVDGVTSPIQGQLDAKAPLVSPALTGAPTAPTASPGTDTTQIATTAYVIAERAATATLTNKTLTTPVISSPSGLVKADVGLANVDNTSDLSKPISTAAQSALDVKQNLNANLTALSGLAGDGLVAKTASGVFASRQIQVGTGLSVTNADGVAGNPLVSIDLAGFPNSANSVAYTPSGTGAVATTVQAKLREFVSVKDFGAVGGGATDDTAAIQAAITESAGKELVFPSGYTFLSGPLTVSSSMILRIDGTLKMRDASGTLMTVSADDVTVCGNGTIDLNNTQDTGIKISGQRPHVYGLTFANMLGGPATSGSSSALNIANASGVFGARIHNLTFRNIQKGTAPAPYVSQPRAMSFDFAKKANVSGIACYDVFVAAGVGAVEDSMFCDISVNSTLATVDNCFYIINSKRCYFDNISIRGWEGEPIVISGCEDISIVGGEINDWNGNSCGFENSTRIEVDGMRFVSNRTSTIFKARSANTSTTGFSMRNVRAKVKGTGDILGFYNGVVNDLVISDCSLEAVIDTGMNINQRFIHMTNTDGFVITDNDFILREATAGFAAAADWTVTLVATAYSDFKRNTFINRTTNGRFRVVGTENNLIASDGLHNQSNISGSRNSNYGLTTSEPRRFFGTAIPTVGTFIRGDSIWNTAPSAGGPICWVCVTAGTPGTWSAFGSGMLTGSSVYNPPSLGSGAGATTTVAVTGAALGDTAIASFGLDLQGITITAYVSAANTVTVRFQNDTAGTLDLAQDTIRVRVFKA